MRSGVRDAGARLLVWRWDLKPPAGGNPGEGTDRRGVGSGAEGLGGQELAMEPEKGEDGLQGPKVVCPEAGRVVCGSAGHAGSW